MKIPVFLLKESTNNVDKYIVNSELPFDVYILSINLETGDVQEKRILEYSIHRNLRMYKISDLHPEKRFQDFWVSEDHSLIVFDKEDGKFKPQKPTIVKENRGQYCLVKSTSPSIKHFIHCDEISIEYDPSVTEAGDFTVEDNFTFCTVDGIFVQDTCAIFTPLSQEALEDVKNKMTNLLHSANPRRLMINFDKEIAAGICLVTKDGDPKIFPWYKKIKVTIKGNKYETTEGRYSIWNFLPDSAKEVSSFEDFNKEINIDEIIQSLVEKGISKEEILDFAHKVEKYVLDCVTKASESIDINTFEISKEISKYLDALDKTKDPLEQQEILKNLEKIVMAKLKNTDIGLLLECGAFKKGQLFQLLGSKGLMISPDGKLVLVKSNFTKGLKPTEFFNASHGARTGIISRTNKTSITGYLMRKLVYGLASVRLDLDTPFCGTTKTLKLKVDSELSKRIINRYAIVDNKLTLLTSDTLKDLDGQYIDLYSPIYCKSQKVCLRCFGRDYELLDSEEIGTLAAQSIGERLTQEMLKAFHTGGVVKPTILDLYQNVEENTRVTKDQISKVLLKKNNDYIANTDIELIFQREDGYNFNTFVRDMEEFLLVEYIICECKSKDLEIPIVFDGNCNVYCPDMTIVNKTNYVLEYNKGSKVLTVLPEVSDMELIAKRILSLVEGRAKVRDEFHLLQNLYRYIKQMGNINLVWLEILVSQLFRDADNPTIPARLGKTWNPKIMSIKQIPYTESWVRGLEFENFGKSVTNALIHDELSMVSKLDELML